MMITDQYDLFGNRKRVVPWKAILQDHTKQIWWHRDDLSESSRNKLIVAKAYADCLDRIGAIEAIRTAPSDKMALRILQAALYHDDVPAQETMARGLRLAKQDLEKSGYAIRQDNGDSTDLETFDELLVQISKQTMNRDSGLEHRFGVFLRKSIPNVHFGHNEAIENNGQIFSVDFIARQYGIIIEIDGYEFHNDLSSFISDRKKWRTLQSWGYIVLSFAGSELTISGGMTNAIEEIKAAIKAKQ